MMDQHFDEASGGETGFTIKGSKGACLSETKSVCACSNNVVKHIVVARCGHVVIGKAPPNVSEAAVVMVLVYMCVCVCVCECVCV